MPNEPIKQDPIKTEESKHLNEVLTKVNDAKSVLEQSLTVMGESNLERLKELKEVEGGPDFEIFLEQLQEKNETFNIKDKYARINELDFLTKEPYFARIDLTDPSSDQKNKLYIGKFGYTEKDPVVTDWRAKVASLYYRYRYPQKNVSYEAPDGKIVYDLDLKRTFEIDNGELIKYYNNDIQLDEKEIIMDKIQNRTGGVLEDIVETIQISQLDIIESDPRQICIVQGCVGSGKSTVAIHKLAHIFFNYPTFIHPERSILIAKNQILVGYLSTLFPKLGIFDISYKTLRELLVHLLFREELNVKVNLDLHQEVDKFGIKEISETQQRIQRLHEDVADKIAHIFKSDTYGSFSGYKYSDAITPYENVSEIISDLEEELEMQKEKLKENPNSARAWLFRENIKVIRNLIKKLSDLKVQLRTKTFQELLKEFGIKPNDTLGYTELLTYIYLYAELVSINKFPKYEYCVVDEGQDFSALEYLVLSKIVLRGRFAIFGDLNQNLEKFGLKDWKEITHVIKEAGNALVFELDTNYRSTKPIIDLANSILKPFTNKYLPKSINRAGSDPDIKVLDNGQELISRFKDALEKDAAELNKSIGVICYDNIDFEKIRDVIYDMNLPAGQFQVLDSKTKIQYIPKGVYLMREEDCKGLEFAKVYVLGLDLTKIHSFDDARKAFVSVTRAMNELTVLGLK